MMILKAFRFRLEPGSAQKQNLARFVGSTRYVWNRALAWQQETYAKTGKILPYVELAALLPQWKREEASRFLAEVPSQALQQTLKDLDRAYWEAFKKMKSFPRFKKKGQHDALRYPQGFKLRTGQIFLPKLGWVKFRQSRVMEGTPKNVTVSRRGAHWFVSIQVELEVQQPCHPSSTMVGIDLGVAQFATFSDDTPPLQPLNSFKKQEKKLASAQRALARKTKFSQNWKKQKAKVQKCHTRIADTRRDSLHKASTQISKNHAVIVLEELKVSNMSASAKGTMEQPGRNVQAKSGLNKAILDQGWHEFQRQLQYKQTWRGGQVLLVPQQYTSQRCAECGHTEAGNRIRQAIFRCQQCGHQDHADRNAAKNILAAGHAVLACGESALLSRSAKQEPTERLLAA